MPSSKSSTSSEKENELRKAAYKRWAEEKNYEALLTDLLAEVHRDGGQYTTLTGYAVSSYDAIEKLRSMRRKLTSLLYKTPKRR